MVYSIYNLELNRFVCYVIVTRKIRDTMDLLPRADEIRVGLANCDHSLAEIWRAVLVFTS